MSTFQSTDKFLVNNASSNATQSHYMTGADLLGGNYDDAIVLVVKEPTAFAPAGSVTTSYKCAISDLASKIPESSISFNYWMLVNRGSISYRVSAQEFLDEYSNGIITDGLTLHFDASNSNSYPGTGTTWSNLASSSYNGVINGASYLSLIHISSPRD